MFHYFRPQDIADILIMSFLVYQLYSWFKNTKALQVVIGLGFLVLLYIVTKNLGLFMTKLGPPGTGDGAVCPFDRDLPDGNQAGAISLQSLEKSIRAARGTARNSI